MRHGTSLVRRRAHPGWQDVTVRSCTQSAITIYRPSSLSDATVQIGPIPTVP